MFFFLFLFRNNKLHLWRWLLQKRGLWPKQVPGCGICCRGGPENLTEATLLQKEVSERLPSPKDLGAGQGASR